MRIIRTILGALATALFAGGLISRAAFGFDCIETKCTEISSCTEARYKLDVCGHGKRDADHDGIPCEVHCSNDWKMYEVRSRNGWPSGVPIAKELPSTPSLGLLPSAEAAEPPGFKTGDFSCDGKKKCIQMVSCKEATFYLKTCGVQSLDGDSDGVPCNSLCR